MDILTHVSIQCQYDFFLKRHFFIALGFKTVYTDIAQLDNTTKEVKIMADSTNNEYWLKFDDFRRNMRYLIASKGVLGIEVAKYIGSTNATVSRYLNGVRDPEIEYVYRLCQYFGVSMDYLLGIHTNKYATLRPDAQHVGELYSAASAEGQERVMEILRKYERE